MTGLTLGLSMGLGSPARPASGKVWRGFGQGMRLPVRSFNAGSTLGAGSRIRRKSKADFRYVRVKTPVFSPQGTSFTASIAAGAPAIMTVTAYTSGTILPGNEVFGGTTAGTVVVAQLTNTNPLGRPGREGTYSLNISQTVASRTMTGPIVDTHFDTKMTFQTALELNYTNALTGIPVRDKIFLTSGVDRFVYDPATWDFSVYHKTWDILDLGAVVPAGTYIGIWTYIEGDAAAIGFIPSTINASSFNNRYEGNFNTAVSLLGVNGAASRTTVSAVGATQSGGGALIGPAALDISVDASFKSVALDGDSIFDGSLEGQTNSGAYGDCEGTIDGVLGWGERGVVDTCGFNVAVNISCGSDRAKYVTGGNVLNSRGRMLLLAESGATSIVSGLGHNDVSSTVTTITYAINTPYEDCDVLIYNGASAYFVYTGGTTGPAVPTDTTGNLFVSGTATLRYMGPAGSGPVRLGWTVLGRLVKLQRLLAATLPNVPRYQTVVTPDSTDVNLWNAAPGTQVASANYGGPTSSRGTCNAGIIAKYVDLQITAAIDPNPVIEYNGSNQSSFWLAPNGIARDLVYDGTHPNSYTHSIMGTQGFTGFPG